jgi:hypothetical protein
MGITNKAISKFFLHVIIRTNHEQTEIVMQYGGLRSSVTCMTTSCSNDSFASPTHRTNQLLDKGFWYVVPLVRHAATVVFPVDFDGGEHVYRVHPINVQLMTDPLIMPAKDEYGCDSGSESLGKHEPRDILHCNVESRDQISLLQKGPNDRIKNIVSIYYDIQCSLNNY